MREREVFFHSFGVITVIEGIGGFMNPTALDLGWGLFVELRKEIIESQKIRAQIIGVKITLVSGAIGYLLSNADKLPAALLAIPAFAAIFFDLLINSYSFSIKRLGHHCHRHIEQRLIRPSLQLPNGYALWQEFLRRRGTQQKFSAMANLGLTALALLPAIYGLLVLSEPAISVGVLILLVISFAYDWRVYYIISPKGPIHVGKKESD